MEARFTYKRRSISKAKRFRILERDKFSCRYCGRKPPEVQLHIDHILPVSRGGSNHDDNLCASCQDCNLSKSAKLIGCFRKTEMAPANEKEESLIKEFKCYWAKCSQFFVRGPYLPMSYLKIASYRDEFLLWIFRKLQDDDYVFQCAYHATWDGGGYFRRGEDYNLGSHWEQFTEFVASRILFHMMKLNYDDWQDAHQRPHSRFRRDKHGYPVELGGREFDIRAARRVSP